MIMLGFVLFARLSLVIALIVLWELHALIVSLLFKLLEEFANVLLVNI